MNLLQTNEDLLPANVQDDEEEELIIDPDKVHTGSTDSECPFAEIPSDGDWTDGDHDDDANLEDEEDTPRTPSVSSDFPIRPKESLAFKHGLLSFEKTTTTKSKSNDKVLLPSSELQEHPPISTKVSRRMKKLWPVIPSKEETSRKLVLLESNFLSICSAFVSLLKKLNLSETVFKNVKLSKLFSLFNELVNKHSTFYELIVSRPYNKISGNVFTASKQMFRTHSQYFVAHGEALSIIQDLISKKITEFDYEWSKKPTEMTKSYFSFFNYINIDNPQFTLDYLFLLPIIHFVKYNILLHDFMASNPPKRERRRLIQALAFLWPLRLTAHEHLGKITRVYNVSFNSSPNIEINSTLFVARSRALTASESNFSPEKLVSDTQSFTPNTKAERELKSLLQRLNEVDAHFPDFQKHVRRLATHIAIASHLDSLKFTIAERRAKKWTSQKTVHQRTSSSLSAYGARQLYESSIPTNVTRPRRKSDTSLDQVIEGIKNSTIYHGIKSLPSRITRNKIINRMNQLKIPWIDLSSRTKCNLCKAEFSINPLHFTRKYRCRLCGEIYCKKCAGDKSYHESFPGLGLIRICEKCKERTRIMALKKEEKEKNIDNGDEKEDSVIIRLDVKQLEREREEKRKNKEEIPL